MTTAIAWGTPYDKGGQPETSPFLAGASGSIARIPLIYEGFAFGLVGGLADGLVAVEHTYAPAAGGPEYLVETLYLDSGAEYGAEAQLRANAGERDGIHKLTATVDFVPLPTKLVLAITPDNDPMDDYYGAAAWYEEAAEPPVSAFWTRFINSKEVIE